VLQSLDSEVEGEEIVALAGQKAFLRLDKIQGVEEMFLGNLVFSGVVDVESVPFLDPFDGELGGRLILDPVTLLEVDADQGSGGEDVVPHFLCGWKANLDPVGLCGDDKTKAEFRLGCTGPSLTGERVLHGRESEGR